MPLRGRNFRGFPFDEEEAGAWSDLAARHPDIAARLRQHPAAANWARKRRPSSQDADDFGDNFSNFDRFPFDDIPPEFREHFPSHFNRRFGQREERPAHSPQPQPSTSRSPPRQQTTATQTEQSPPPQHTPIPQYGLRNTVDLGQKSAQDPSLVDADERNQRSMSAPPESRNHAPKMSGQNQEQHAEQSSQPQKVRNIPIFVEGRDKPVINETLDGATHFGETKPTYHPQQPPLDNSYFAEEASPMYQQPHNFSKAFGSPAFGKQYRGGAQPFVQQKVYPQTFARGASPGRAQSPKPHEEVKIPVQHEKPQQARPEPSRQQQPPKQQHQQPPQHHQQHPQQQQPPQQQPPKQPTPPPQAKQQQQPPDPITQILAIQTDVLNLMTEVEKFTGSKKDKRYIYLDEMLTRNLIKLDTIETDGKENIRNARKEAIRCIQKCIAVLEAKADNKNVSTQENQLEGQDEEMNAEAQTEEKTTQNGEVDMTEKPKEEAKAEQVETQQNEHISEPPVTENKEPPQAADTRPQESVSTADDAEKKQKKVKNVKKRDKSKDKVGGEEKMEIDDKGENKEQQAMDVDGAASQ